jgi:hypothetical protein
VGVCTGLFVSKLTSRLFDLPIWTLLLLTLYVMLQPVFGAITRQDPYMEGIQYALVLMALYTKFAMLVVIEWKRDNYRILYFMLRAAQIEQDEKSRKTYDEFKLLAHQTFNPGSRVSTAAQPSGRADRFGISIWRARQRWLRELRERPIRIAGAVLSLFLIAAGARLAFPGRQGWSESVPSVEVVEFVEAVVLGILLLYVLLKVPRDQRTTVKRKISFAGL